MMMTPGIGFDAGFASYTSPSFVVAVRDEGDYFSVTVQAPSGPRGELHGREGPSAVLKLAMSTAPSEAAATPRSNAA